MKYAVLVPLVNEILSQYPTMRLTLRQIYYRLVAVHNYPNKRSSYNQLSSQLVTAREKGEVNENRIEDRTRSFLGGIVGLIPTSEGSSRVSIFDQGWRDSDTFIETVKETFFDYWNYYVRDLWLDQEQFVVVWVEKDALSRVVSDSCDKYRVITAPSRGYASYSYIRKATTLLPKDKPTVVLHFSDHDPSGLDMTRDLGNRFYRYTQKKVTIERIALTYDQVKEYDLTPNPTKMADTRARDYVEQYGEGCYELDAIEPEELQRLVKEAILKHLDEDQWKESLKQEEEQKQELEPIFDRWREVIEETEE